MTDLLEKEGHEIKKAESGLVALDILQIYTPDVMFVDLVMPHISGKKLCQVIRSKPELKNVYLIILSAISAEAEVGFADFADACIAKGPFKKMSGYIIAVLEQLDMKTPQDLTREIIGLEDIYHREITKELLVTKKHLEVMFDNMSEGIIELTTEARIVYINPAAISILGQTEEKLIASDFVELFSDVDRKLVNELLGREGYITWRSTEDSPVILNGRQISMNIQTAKEGEHKAFIVILHDITKRKKAEEERKKVVFELQNALAKIKTLRGLIPICANCKKIRNDEGYWQQVEIYVKDHSEAEFTHSVCPECMKKLYPELD